MNKRKKVAKSSAAANLTVYLFIYLFIYLLHIGKKSDYKCLQLI